jgi:ribosomal protein S27AE
VYEKVGLKQDDEKETKATKEVSDTCGLGLFLADYSDELVCNDQLTNELVSFGDWRNPVMSL